MATFLSGATIGYWTNPNNTMYGTLTGTVSRNGNTVTLSGMSLHITSTYSSYGSSSEAMVVGGTTSYFTVSFGSGSTDAGSYSLSDTSFSVQPADTSATVNWTYLGGTTDPTGSGSFTVTFPAGVVAPTTPTISATAVNTTTASVTYGTISFGTPSTGTVTLYGGTTANPTTVLDTYSSTGDHTFTHTGLTPGTTYYYRAKASNGQADSGYSTELSVTIPTHILYGSVNGASEKIEKLYGSVNGASKEILKLYGSVAVQTTIGVTGSIRSGGAGNVTAFDADVFWNAASSRLDLTKTLDYISVMIGRSGAKIGMYVYYDGGTHTTIAEPSTVSGLAAYGVTASFVADGTDYIDLTPITGTTYVAKQIF